MNKNYRIDQGDITLEVGLQVDYKKFTDEVGKAINEFWTDSEDRADHAGSHTEAALRLIAREALSQAAFNNFLTPKWVMQQFDWSINKGVEGFPTLQDVGVTILYVDNLQFDFEVIESE